MDATELIKQYWAVIALAAVAVAALVIALIATWRSDTRTKRMSPDELRFRNVFAMMSEERRQSLLEYTARKYGCNRREAMRHAVEDRARDESRW